MSDPYESDSIPNEHDALSALEMFCDEHGCVSVDRLARTVGRLHRKEGAHQAAINALRNSVEQTRDHIDTLAVEFNEHKDNTMLHNKEIKTCLLGDEMGMSKGLIAEHKEVKAMITEIYQQQTGKHDTTAIHKKDDNEYIKKVVYMIVGVLIFLGAVVPMILSLLGLFK